MKVLIITGAVSSGKSTVISELKSRDIYVIEETASQVIKEYKESKLLLPWNGGNWKEFQMAVYEQMVYEIEEAKVYDPELIVLDRGTEDIQLYALNHDCYIDNWNATFMLFDIPVEDCKVYMLRRLQFEDNNIRYTVTEEERKQEYDQLLDMYTAFDYTIYREPEIEMSFEQRMSYISNLIIDWNDVSNDKFRSDLCFQETNS
jgi:predicted ATPase